MVAIQNVLTPHSTNSNRGVACLIRPEPRGYSIPRHRSDSLEPEIRQPFVKLDPTLDPKTVTTAGASDFRDVVSDQDIGSVLQTYSTTSCSILRLG